MYITTGGLILRETTYKESSKILTVLTNHEGKITVNARGARRRGSKSAAATQLFTYSEMTLYSGRGGWTLTEARSIEQFERLRDDIEKISLVSYFAQLLDLVSDEDIPNPEILRLGLNSFFAVSESLGDDELIKAAFELRLMCEAGYAPQTDCCAVCGKERPNDPYFDLGGALRCRTCTSDGIHPSVRLTDDALDAMRYITSCDLKRLFSFKLSEDGKKCLCSAAERYVKTQLDHDFYTLDYYKKVKIK